MQPAPRLLGLGRLLRNAQVGLGTQAVPAGRGVAVSESIADARLVQGQQESKLLANAVMFGSKAEAGAQVCDAPLPAQPRPAASADYLAPLGPL